MKNGLLGTADPGCRRKEKAAWLQSTLSPQISDLERAFLGDLRIFHKWRFYNPQPPENWELNLPLGQVQERPWKKNCLGPRWAAGVPPPTCPHIHATAHHLCLQDYTSSKLQWFKPLSSSFQSKLLLYQIISTGCFVPCFPWSLPLICLYPVRLLSICGNHWSLLRVNPRLTKTVLSPNPQYLRTRPYLEIAPIKFKTRSWGNALISMIGNLIKKVESRSPIRHK